VQPGRGRGRGVSEETVLRLPPLVDRGLGRASRALGGDPEDEERGGVEIRTDTNTAR
jgi:hypothetical protein